MTRASNFIVSVISLAIFSLLLFVLGWPGWKYTNNAVKSACLGEVKRISVEDKMAERGIAFGSPDYICNIKLGPEYFGTQPKFMEKPKLWQILTKPLAYAYYGNKYALSLIFGKGGDELIYESASFSPKMTQGKDAFLSFVRGSLKVTNRPSSGRYVEPVDDKAAEESIAKVKAAASAAAAIRSAAASEATKK